MDNANEYSMFLRPERPFLLIYTDDDSVSYSWLETESDLRELTAEIKSFGGEIQDAIEIGSLREIDLGKE